MKTGIRSFWWSVRHVGSPGPGFHSALGRYSGAVPPSRRKRESDLYSAYQQKNRFR